MIYTRAIFKNYYVTYLPVLIITQKPCITAKGAFSSVRSGECVDGTEPKLRQSIRLIASTSRGRTAFHIRHLRVFPLSLIKSDTEPDPVSRFLRKTNVSTIIPSRCEREKFGFPGADTT